MVNMKKTPTITITSADLAKDRRRARREQALNGPPLHSTRRESAKRYNRTAMKRAAWDG